MAIQSSDLKTAKKVGHKKTFCLSVQCLYYESAITLRSETCRYSTPSYESQ